MSSPSYASVRYASLAGRHVAITGGASGIGAEMVRAFTAQAARVSFLDIDAEAGTALAAETGAAFHRADVTDIDALRGALAAMNAAQPLDALVNNAARDDRHGVETVEPDDWRRTLALNLDHQFFASQAVAGFMQARGAAGAILLLGSISWMRGRPGMVGYTTAKAAIHGLTKTLAREWGAAGIRVNGLVPGAIRTARQDALWLTPALNQQFLDLQALKFRLEAHHVARMALFLASDESAGCTGGHFLVDAGLTQN